jgi:serine/threonine protein kinase
LAEVPQLSEKWLYRGFSCILEALKKMHNLNLVHMDVKSDNVFVDDHSNWNLGDFGSARTVGSTIWSYTEVLNPYVIPKTATVIPQMDFVLLCVTIAIELKKDKWKLLCGKEQKVQAHLVMEKLNSLKDDVFKKEIVELFESSLKTVHKHFELFEY